MHAKKFAPTSSSPDPRDGELRQLREKVKTLTDLAGRAQADLQNAKARLSKQATELGSVAVAEFLRTILPTLDAFQRAFQHLPDGLVQDEWVKGVVAIEQGLVRQVEALGLRRMTSVGQPLDPHRHEVLMTVPGDPGTVVEVVEEGYEFRGRVLRPAKVKVGVGSGSGLGSAVPRTDASTSGAGVTTPTSSPAPKPTSGEAEGGRG